MNTCPNLHDLYPDHHAVVCNKVNRLISRGTCNRCFAEGKEANHLIKNPTPLSLNETNEINKTCGKCNKSKQEFQARLKLASTSQQSRLGYEFHNRLLE